MIDKEMVLGHKFKGIDSSKFYDEVGNKISDKEVYAFRAGWNEALDIVALSCDSDGQIVEWIDVRDELPDDGDCVLVAWIPVGGMPTTMWRHFYGLATYHDPDFLYINSNGFEIDRVIAWMRLPSDFEG